MSKLMARIGAAAVAPFPALAVAIVVAVATGGNAATQPNGAAELAAQPADEIERFCGNIADAARDRRYALQAAQLKDLQKDVDERIAKLETKRAEYEEWVTRREHFMAQAQLGVVEIYSKMRPDAAAAQLTELRADMAASILMKLDARVASVILNEMDKNAAATLTAIMVSAARPEDPS
jgi:flagellar motility protein MotE (MotC chaperone)